MSIDLFVLGAALLAIASIFLPTLLTQASPLPTSAAVRQTMLAVLPEHLDGPVYELGAGWGGLAVALARRYPQTPVQGFEVSILPWGFSKVRQIIGGQKNLRFRFGNFLKADLSAAALVVCYLPGPAMEKLKAKLEAELKPGALVLSNTFALAGWQAVEERTAPDIHASRVYLYKIT